MLPTAAHAVAVPPNIAIALPLIAIQAATSPTNGGPIASSVAVSIMPITMAIVSTGSSIANIGIAILAGGTGARPWDGRG
jgi:hypothetical protein